MTAGRRRTRCGARLRGGAISAATAVSLLWGVGLAHAQEERPHERFSAFLSFFEPETSAALGLSGEMGRLSDRGEEGLAARARGYRQLRNAAALLRLFPEAPSPLVAAVDPVLFLDRRITTFSRVREWARSPLHYVRAAAEALALVELDPGLGPRERRRALTERARQLPYLLDAAAAALVNPPRILAGQALVEGRLLQTWIAEAAARGGKLPEGGEKWALAQSLEAAADAVAAFLDMLEADFAARANGVPGLGEDVLSELARTYGFDGAYHVAETLARAVEALESAHGLDAALTREAPTGMTNFGPPPAHAAAPPSEPAQIGPDSVGSLASMLVAGWPGSAPVPAVATRFGPRIAGRLPVSVAWRPGTPAISGGLAWLYVADDVARTPYLVEAALADAASQVWIRAAVGVGPAPPDPWTAARLFVAHEGLAPAARWFALAGPIATPDRGRRAAQAAVRPAAELALAEAEAARIATLVHLGLLRADDAIQQLAGIAGAGSAEAARLLANHLSEPSGIFAPALGFVVFELWIQQGRPPPASLFADWLGAEGERP